MLLFHCFYHLHIPQCHLIRDRRTDYQKKMHELKAKNSVIFTDLYSQLCYGTIKVQQQGLCSKHCHVSGLISNLVWKIFTENKSRQLALPWEDLNVPCCLPAGFPGVAVTTGLNNFSSIFASFTYWHDFPSSTMLLRTLRDINLEKNCLHICISTLK